MPGKTVAAATLGCKVNFTETEGILELFRRDGYAVVDFGEAADVYVVNTCAVTGESGKKSRQTVRRARKTNPNAVVAVVGCYSQVSPGEIDADVVIGTKDRASLIRLVNEEWGIRNGKLGSKRSVVSVYDLGETLDYEVLPVGAVSGRTRAFVKVQDGCGNFCAYCIIPIARGGVRCRPLDDIKEEIEQAAKGGCKEVVLTGVNLSAYGAGLVDVIKAANVVPRVRLGSIDPSFVTAEFVAALREAGNVCPHFHLPLQSGCDKTLKRMNRRYDSGVYAKAAALLRGAFPNAALTTDVIVGFPGESAADFNESAAFIERTELSRLHVFPFSAREGTAAAKMSERVGSAEITKRKKQLLELGKKLEHQYKQQFFGKELNVLIEEKTGENTYRGLSENYLDVGVVSGYDVINRIMSVRINENDCILL